MNLLKWLSPFFMVEVTTLWGGKGSTPPAPDYRAAAEETAASNKEALNMQTWANRPTQNTPWGSTTWDTTSTIDPATGQKVTAWTQNETLDPALQSALDDQLAIQAGRSDLAGSFMGRVANEYSQPFNWSDLPGMANTPQAQFTYGTNLQTGYADPGRLSTQYFGNTTNPYQSISPTTQTTNEPAFAQQRMDLMNANFNRMAPQHQRQEDQARTMLANQGLTPGSEAYNTELERLHQQQAGERWNALEQSGQEQARMQQMLLGQQQQAFGQQQQAGMFGLGAQQQGFNQSLAGQQAYNQALQGQQGLDQSRAQFYNTAQQNMFNQNQAANAQNWQQMMQQAEYQNRLRQQAIAERQQARGMSLNEMNALLTGQQVSNPNMPSFQGAGNAGGTNYMGAAQAQYQAGLDQYNAQQQQQQGMMSGIGQIAGTAGMIFL